LGVKIWLVATGRREKTETLKQAQKRLGISRTTLWRLIRKYKIEVADDVLDGRSKRVKTSDVDRILKDAMRIRKGRF
jgi:excisionase family DNA binding protein